MSHHQISNDSGSVVFGQLLGMADHITAVLGTRIYSLFLLVDQLKFFSRFTRLPRVQVHAIWSSNGSYSLLDPQSKWESRNASWRSGWTQTTKKWNKQEIVQNVNCDIHLMKYLIAVIIVSVLIFISTVKYVLSRVLNYCKTVQQAVCNLCTQW